MVFSKFSCGIVEYGCPMDARTALTNLSRLAKMNSSHCLTLMDALDSDLDNLLPIAINVAVETGDPMARYLGVVLNDRKPNVDFHKLRQLIPEKTTSLRHVATLVSMYCLEDFRLTEHTPENLLRYAHNFVECGRTFIAFGWPSKALNVLQHAFEVYLTLRERMECEVTDQIITTLCLTSEACLAIDDYGPALMASSQMSKEVIRAGRGNPDGNLDRHFIAQLLLARSAAGIGKPSDAALAARYAIWTYQKLDNTRARALQSEYCDALVLLARLTLLDGNLSESLTHIEEALAQVRPLHDRDPDAFAMPLLRTLTAYAEVCIGAQKIPESVAAITEAVDDFERTAILGVDALTADYVDALRVAIEIHTRAGNMDKVTSLRQGYEGLLAYVNRHREEESRKAAQYLSGKADAENR